MDISDDRSKLREVATIISNRETEPVTPHIFDYLQRIPRPNQFTNIEDEVAKEEQDEGGERKRREG